MDYAKIPEKEVNRQKKYPLVIQADIQKNNYILILDII